MPPALSVVIPSYQPRREHLQALYDSLLRQTFTDFEALLLDDASPDASVYAPITDPRFRVVHNPENRGPAVRRNQGAALAAADRLFFTDTDCELAPDALHQAHNGLAHDGILSGNTVTRALTPFGRAVALLGFPGGGALGFDKVWRVSQDGYTSSFSSCNLAFRQGVFEALGRFDEAFPVAGGEDTVLAYQAVQSGHRIRYAPRMVVYHVEKETLRGFLRWQLTRGRGNYHIKRRVRRVGGYLRLRCWTFRNSLAAAGVRYALPVLALIFLSVIFQVLGMWQEGRTRHTRAVQSDGRA